MWEAQPNQALHRIAARLRMLLNLKRPVWAARGERWPLGLSHKHRTMSEDTLKSRKDRAEILKLITETRLLRLQLSSRYRRVELLKAIASLAGVITAFVALGGFFFSFWQYQNQLRSEREARSIEQINNSIRLLSESNAAKQLAGIASLTPLLHSGDHLLDHHISSILNVFARILAVENKPIVRDALVSTISHVDQALVGNGVVEDSLYALVKANHSP